MKARFIFTFVLSTIMIIAAAAPAAAEDAETEEWSCGQGLDFYMPAGGPAGSVITITGNDADPGNVIQFLWDGSPAGSTTANASGNFSIQINVPADALVGPHTVTFVGWDSQDVPLNCPGTFIVTEATSPGIAPEQPGASGTDTPATQQSISQGSTGTTSTATSLPSTGFPLLPAAAVAFGGLGLAALGWRGV